MRSSLSFRFVVDVVSQALAWVYLGEKLDQLRTIGLRGAYEINVFLYDLYNGGGAGKSFSGRRVTGRREVGKVPKGRHFVRVRPNCSRSDNGVPSRSGLGQNS
jgi:hypothetical protein